jgi:hypothetical protein
MGTFYTKRKVENPIDRTRSVLVPKLLVEEVGTFPSRGIETFGAQTEESAFCALTKADSSLHSE